jgi:CheY-like chemotaxis protein
MIPKMDGFTFFQQFRDTIHADIPFIFLTAKSEYADIRAGMMQGADDYLIKPVKGTEVIEAIQITAIICFLDLIKAKIDTIDRKILEEYLFYIEKGANRIINLLMKVTT